MPSASIRPLALVRSQFSWSIAGAHYKHWATSLGNFGVTPFFGGNLLKNIRLNVGASQSHRRPALRTTCFERSHNVEVRRARCLLGLSFIYLFNIWPSKIVFMWHMFDDGYTWGHVRGCVFVYIYTFPKTSSKTVCLIKWYQEFHIPHFVKYLSVLLSLFENGLYVLVCERERLGETTRETEIDWCCFHYSMRNRLVCWKLCLPESSSF